MGASNMADPAPPKLLDSCLLAFVQSSSLSENMIAELSAVAEDNGATILRPNRKATVRVGEATHVISNTIDFEEYVEAQSFMVPVVTAAWLKNSVAKGKVAQVRPYSPDPRMIFSSVILTCADIPPTDKETIIGATMALGGMESKDLTRATTHICALTLDHPKCQEAIKKNSKCKIVLPHWFDDCFALGKRIDEGPYLLPDPEIMRLGVKDPVNVPSVQQLEGATMPVPTRGIPGRTPVTIFANKKVMLADDLPIKDTRFRGILVDIIQSGKGTVVDSADACDMFICHYRDGPEYVRAAQQGKDVGNLAWLYHIITHNEWTSPLRRLLHYPIPRDGIPGFEDLRISISNYGGDARIYLENLITACGAAFTKSMKADNTHLITACMKSEKVDAARDWNVEIVNHLWIEESYAKCQVQSLTQTKYHHFPPRTNLGEVIGQTFHDERTLHDMFYPGGDDDLDSVAMRKRNMIQTAQENVYSPRRGRSSKVDVMAESSPLPKAATMAAAKAASKAKPDTFITPAKGRRVRTSNESETPSIVSTGSRKSKSQALSKIQGLAPDIALYEKEKKRATKDGHGPWGGKRAADQIDRERSARASSPATEADDADVTASGRRPAKRARMSSLPQVEMRICVTGYSRWSGAGLNKEDADKRKLRSMGILLVTETQSYNYLAAPRVVRTKKFLIGLAKGAEILDSAFIDACLDEGEAADPQKFILKDKENEAKFEVTLKQAVARARANAGKLLRHVPIYCTADVKNGVDSFQAIAEANGAIFKIYKARSGTTIKPTTPEQDGGAAPDPVYLLSGNLPSEKVLWPKFEKMAREGHMEPRIVIADWLLDVAMRQELFFRDQYLVSKFYNK